METVKIVRCKDCVFWDITWKSCNDHEQVIYHYCPIIDKETYDNFFCAECETVYEENEKMMDIEEAKAIYWMIENCLNADCNGLQDCRTCDYNVTDERADEAAALLTSAGLLDDEGELI